MSTTFSIQNEKCTLHLILLDDKASSQHPIAIYSETCIHIRIYICLNLILLSLSLWLFLYQMVAKVREIEVKITWNRQWWAHIGCCIAGQWHFICREHIVHCTKETHERHAHYMTVTEAHTITNAQMKRGGEVCVSHKFIIIIILHFFSLWNWPLEIGCMRREHRIYAHIIIIQFTHI